MMKNNSLILFLFVIIFASCTGLKTGSKGLENEAYLEFIANPADFPQSLEVEIDSNYSFEADVHKEKTGRPNGKFYAISTGRHLLTVKYQGEIIYSKEIFVATQETKQIRL